MISVDEALDRLLALVGRLPPEAVPLREASGRVLAEPLQARRDQPPFSASAMDGYAMQKAGGNEGNTLQVIGEAAAGHRFTGEVNSGEAVRIFTGAPMPAGAEIVILQEDVTRNGDQIVITGRPGTSNHVRPAGGDFAAGDSLDAPRLLSPADIALLASMNIPSVPVIRRPQVAIIATGDELVQPGEDPGPDQIIASNSFGLAALLAANGATPRLLPIAKDTRSSLTTTFNLAEGADLIVTIGGASVGDHDLVGSVAADLGLKQSFYKIAMRPGKPLMGGRLMDTPMIGLPGNPVSAMVCGHVFLLPIIRALLGLSPESKTEQATLCHDLPENGPRQHYMRGHLSQDGVTVFQRQDSSLLSVLSQANCLAIRPVNDPPRRTGDRIDILRI